MSFGIAQHCLAIAYRQAFKDETLIEFCPDPVERDKRVRRNLGEWFAGAPLDVLQNVGADFEAKMFAEEPLETEGLSEGSSVVVNFLDAKDKRTHR